ncbi:hypothetical protein RIF23_05555 [Lipingzhangella sp. LS1_29]|uniref:4'-phosphopantetheinyl transferase n=1 Tax=Lipingzhangella rawalii TaxID=2055835 RepID=A0ABU2H373_9ACTN|nr:DUF6758 family protein [Lipingzhangella rawalii]MDS1269757.1 hypothetical protein [Lipingzhangella rawalii]
MRSDPTCPRCGRAVHAPNLWSSAWECAVHGPVAPLHEVRRATSATLQALVTTTRVPVWIPWPLPAGWLVTGLAHAGDERTGAVASVVGLSGPAPLGGVGELAVVAEDMGIGVGARLAGLEGPDPGEGFDEHPADGKVRFDGHEIALWTLNAGRQRAVYVGEALGRWIWFVFGSADQGIAMCEVSGLRDLRDLTGDAEARLALDPPFGALSPFLTRELAPRS